MNVDIIVEVVIVGASLPLLMDVSVGLGDVSSRVGCLRQVV